MSLALKHSTRRPKAGRMLLLPLLLGLLLAAACSIPGSCDDEDASYAAARFKQTVDELSSDSTVSDLLLWGIREGQPDSLIYDSTTAIRITLPLDPHSLSTSFVLVLDSISDTLTFWHKQELYLHSESCGFRYRFTLDSAAVAGSVFSGVELLNESIDAYLETSDEEDLWIHF